MSTINPIPPGGIVSVPDSSGGAGAAVVTSQVINAKWANAILMANASTDRTNGAIAMTNPAPQMNVVSVDKTYLPPPPPNIGFYSMLDIKTMYDDARIDLASLIDSSFTSFIATYFPNPAYYNDAMAWAHSAFTTGGTGINTNVEAALWERGRSRILTQAKQDEDDVTAMWASRGFAMPPGALLNSLNLSKQKSRDQLAEVNRDIAIKSFEAELENVKFAVGRVIDQHKVALDAAGDYIKTVMMGPTVAMQLATSQVDQRYRFQQAMVSLYQAEVAAADPAIRLSIADAQVREAGNEANLRALMSSVDSRVNAALADARMVGNIAASSLNGISAGASVSGNDSSSL